MYAKLVVGLQLAALAAASQVVPRQTESSSTSSDAPEETGSSGGDMSPEQCTSKMSSLMEGMPTGVPVFHNETNTYYKEAATVTTEIPHTDCGFLTAFTHVFVKEPAAWAGDVQRWADDEDTQKAFKDIQDGCEEWKDLEEIPTCVNETKEWLMEEGGLSEGTVEELMSGASARAVSVLSLAALAGAVAMLL